MEKREFHGIEMDVTRYNASKDMMRMGLMSASADYSADNGIRDGLLFFQRKDIGKAANKALFNAGIARPGSRRA